MAAAARAAQAQMLKSQYGFSDAQVTKYRNKEEAVQKAHVAKIAVLRNQMNGAPAAEKRRIVGEMKKLEEQREKQFAAALLAVATPEQKKKIAAARPGTGG
jgi:hypothetical protein